MPSTTSWRPCLRRFRCLAMVTGSAAAEADGTAVTGQWLIWFAKRRPQPGGAGVLTPRRQQASDRWEEIWQQPNNQTGPA